MRTQHIVFLSPMRCHQFDVAAELALKNTKCTVITAYPKWKLKNEKFSLEGVRTFPWVMTPKLAMSRYVNIPEFLEMIHQLKTSPMASLSTLGSTVESWSEEIVRMWRFTKTNSITEGLHNKMEMITRRAYGMRNFENYRLRVRVHCGY